MKKIIFLLTILAFVASAIAQNSKKTIALLEPLVGEGSTKVEGIEKAMVRGEMRKAICLIDGFNAVTRTDIDQLMKEYGFQNSGIVSEQQRKEIGNLRVADYICVSKITKSSTKFYLEAYLIDIESGDISSPSSQYGNLVNGEYDVSLCQALAKDLTSVLPGSARIVDESYIDLGLPSGTKWRSYNATGFYTYDDAVQRFGDRLPTKKQWDELYSECRWQWTSNGFKVIGPNGKSITLPMEYHRKTWQDYKLWGTGFCANRIKYVTVTDEYEEISYWSSTDDGLEKAWGLYLYKEIKVKYAFKPDKTFKVVRRERSEKNSVRLVQNVPK